MKLVTDIIERGWIPEQLIRLAIRSTLKRRLAAHITEDIEAKTTYFRSLLEELRDGPIKSSESESDFRASDLPTDFFKTILGAHMKSSSGFWPVGVQDLDEAQLEALANICHRAELADGMRILDVGCGWGSLSLWISENFKNCEVVALTSDPHYATFVREEAERRSLGGIHVEISELEGYKPEHSFDRIISIESLVHLRNYEKVLGLFGSWLKDDGLVFIELFCHREMAYLLGGENPYELMGRYFLLGGMMPSDNLLLYLQKDLLIRHHWRIGGLHYARTADAWLENLDATREDLIPMLEQKYGSEAMSYYHRWKMFFLILSELFQARSGGEWTVSHYLMEKPGRIE